MRNRHKAKISKHSVLAIFAFALMTAPQHSLAFDKSARVTVSSGASDSNKNRPYKPENGRTFSTPFGEIPEGLSYKSIQEIAGEPAQKIILTPQSTLWIYYVQNPDTEQGAAQPSVTIGRRVYLDPSGKFKDLGPVNTQQNISGSFSKKEVRFYFTNGSLASVTQ